MAYQRATLDEWEIKHWSATGPLQVVVEQYRLRPTDADAELRIHYLDRLARFGRQQLRQWAQDAREKGILVYPLKEYDWQVAPSHGLQFYLVLGKCPVIRVEVRLSTGLRPQVREYPLPFGLT